MIRGMKPQTIIQGKTYGLRIKFSAVDLAKFNKMWFSCSSLNLVKEMTFDGTDTYFMEISWEDTLKMKPCTTSFNITVKLIGVAGKRDLANGVPLTVEQNRNPVPEEE